MAKKAYRGRKRKSGCIKIILGIAALLVLTYLLLDAMGIIDKYVATLADNSRNGTSSTATQTSDGSGQSETDTASESQTAETDTAETDTAETDPTETDPAETYPAESEDPPVPVTDMPAYVDSGIGSDGTFFKKFEDGSIINWWIYRDRDGSGPISGYKPESTVVFPSSRRFTEVEGVLTFRGNNYRNAPAWGSADVTGKKLEIIWTHEIGAISGTGSYWPGAGWTGQPLLVHWPESTRRVMGIKDEFIDKDLVEVIYPVFDGNIYFLDIETGKPTREPIEVGFGFKGTGSVDPRGYPLFYQGQGLNDTNGKIGIFKYRIFDLIHNKEIYGIPGRDPAAFRTWGAFDPSALIDRQTDTLIEPSENGLVYKVKLNTVFDPDLKTVTIDPEIMRFKYKASFQKYHGIESSPAIFRNLLYFSDNSGTIVCMDINTMEPFWVFNAGDDSDATIVLEETTDGVFLYHGNAIDKRCKDTDKTGANCNIRKLDALTGELIWQYDIPCIYESYLNAGMLATPLIGKDDISDLIIFNIAKTKDSNSGVLAALDKQTGKPVWQRELSAYSWSSPIGIKGKNGKTYGVFCDFKGDMHLFDPRTGADLDVVSLGQNVEASPSAYNDMIVVASYDQKIFGIRIK